MNVVTSFPEKDETLHFNVNKNSEKDTNTAIIILIKNEPAVSLNKSLKPAPEGIHMQFLYCHYNKNTICYNKKLKPKGISLIQNHFYGQITWL